MSLSPYFLNYSCPQWPHRLIDQNFGLTLTPSDLISAASTPVVPQLRPWLPKDIGTTIKTDNIKFQINVDVQHFAPDEITVKTNDGFVIIEGVHEEKKDEHGFVARQFSRRFKLPDGTSPDTVVSKLSSDGVLTVIAPIKSDCVQDERAVPITHTGPIRQEIDIPQ